MGCDIHIVVECRYKDKWVGVHACENAHADSHGLYVVGTAYSELPKSWGAYWNCQRRNYDLFADLAGVRGEGPEPRGIPDDISDLADMVINKWGRDGHSHTYYTLRECGTHFLTAYAPHKLLNEERVPFLCTFFGLDDVYGISDIYDTPDKVLDNVRLIIFFDN